MAVSSPPLSARTARSARWGACRGAGLQSPGGVLEVCEQMGDLLEGDQWRHRSLLGGEAGEQLAGDDDEGLVLVDVAPLGRAFRVGVAVALDEDVAGLDVSSRVGQLPWSEVVPMNLSVMSPSIAAGWRISMLRLASGWPTVARNCCHGPAGRACRQPGTTKRPPASPKGGQGAWCYGY